MIRTHRVASRRLPLGAAIVLGGLLSITLLPCTAHAVTISGSTYASNTGGPPTNPASTSYNSTNPTSVSANIRSDVTWAHAQSWASAYVTGAGVTKTSGGRGWVDTPPTATPSYFDAKSTLWNAYASGTQLIVNGPGATEQLNFSIPANGVPAGFNAFPGSAPGDPGKMAPPSNGQGIIANGGMGLGSLPSFFDVFVQVDATAQQGAAPVQDLFHGKFTFDPSTGQFQGNNTSATAPGFAGVSPIITQNALDDPTKPRYTLSFPADILGNPFNAAVGVPFNANIDVYMTMGDPNRQFGNNPGFTPGSFDFSAYNSMAPGIGPVGAAGGIQAQLLVSDPSKFTVTAAPEPGSLVLAAIGALGACWAVRRRSKR